MRNIDINSRRLSSTFDLYHSMNHILQEFSHLLAIKDSLNRKNEVVRRKYGQSIFLEIPDNRTCADAGIGDDYCVCSVPVKISSDRADAVVIAPLRLNLSI
ncbi:unnamed protein product [Allacma fusca]|uniref:Uncharacterized protein n=1 Tax=Allacma fusca TaxID=39272 RepID=A0A8J2LQB0_9HEXA|nr:unnamed protein product [Allacma fusca]